MLLSTTYCGCGEASGLIHSGILSNAFWVSIKLSISMLLITLVDSSRDKITGVTVNFADFDIPALSKRNPINR
jgi:hypothetical protein